jgi:hypothetical protein
MCSVVECAGSAAAEMVAARKKRGRVDVHFMMGILCGVLDSGNFVVDIWSGERDIRDVLSGYIHYGDST